MTQTTATDESAVDGQPLVWLMGKPARPRILTVFVDERSRDHSVSEVAEQAGVARPTVYDHLDDFLDLGIIEATRKTGPSQRYQLDMDNPVAEALARLDGVTLKALYERDGYEFSEE